MTGQTVEIATGRYAGRTARVTGRTADRIAVDIDGTLVLYPPKRLIPSPRSAHATTPPAAHAAR